VCHLSFLVAVVAMIAGLYTGMSLGVGPFRGVAALVADIALMAQFPVAHSLLLSQRGRTWLSCLAPLGLGPALGTTTYATIASWQLLLTFVLWSPLSDQRWVPHGAVLVTMSLAYAAAWLALLKTMSDAGLEVQTGYLGWGSVFRGRQPSFRGFEPRGTFRFVRQPVYVAFAMTLWSAPVWTIDRLLIALSWTAYCVVAPLHKERRYRAAYGERFERYRRLVPYWVPRRRPADLGELHEPFAVSGAGEVSSSPPAEAPVAPAQPPVALREPSPPAAPRASSTATATEPAPREDSARTSTIVSVAGAHPPHFYTQDELLDAFRRHMGGAHHNTARLEALHRSVSVGSRHLALPIDEYPRLRGFGEANDAYIRVGTDVATEALSKALDAAGLEPRDVDAIFFTSVTGLAVPSIDARLVNRLGLRDDVKRLPLFGLGCVAGAAGIARVHDYLLAWPDHVAVLVSLELCSLTLQREDFSIPNLISSGLFGDGAAAVVMAGAGRAATMPAAAGPRVLASRSRFYPGTERVMGWDVGDSGFRIVLSAGVPDVVRRWLGDDVRGFLADHGIEREAIRSWVCHPGGPKVLDAFEETLGLAAEDLALTRRSLAEVGNMSSSSVLFVLHDTIATRRPAPGSLGLVLALGPGFCSEIVLVQW
jgi:alkylresorcinol/alkylpyrone synthase